MGALSAGAANEKILAVSFLPGGGAGRLDRAGSVEADFDSFLLRFGERAYKFAWRLSGNGEESREIVQEAFYRVLRFWDDYDPERSAEAWFFKILKNVYLDALRRRSRRPSESLDRVLDAGDGEGRPVLEMVSDGEEGPLEHLERLEDLQTAQSVMEGLPVEFRAALTLTEIEGLSYEEAATVLDVPVGTVRSRIARARAALRRSLSERENWP